MFRTLTLASVLLLAAGCAPKRIRALEDEVATRDQTIQSLQTQNQGYVIELTTLRTEVDHLGAKNKELAELYASITDEFGPSITDGNAQLVIFPDRSVITIGDGITFASGSAEVDASSAAGLDRLAAFIQSHPGRRFQVEGHTDDQAIHNAEFASNWELGAARAVTVVAALVQRGVPEQQLSAASFGQTSPMATNSHPDGMAANRRIAVAVQTSVKESGAQVALLEAARRAGGARYAMATMDPEGKLTMVDQH